MKIIKRILLASLVVGNLFAFKSISYQNNSTIQGVVLKAYIDRGYGKWRNKWLFIDIKSNGKIYKIAIAPIFKISNLPINEGDEVKVDGFTPPVFPNGVIKAVEIYDITQKKDYPIWGRHY